MPGQHAISVRIVRTSRAVSIGRLVLGALMSVFFIGCEVCIIGAPDQTQFAQHIRSDALQDSLKHKALCPGMPYWVVTQMFQGCKACADTGIAVAGVGSTQELGQSEGFGRTFADDDIGVYMDVYDTQQGELRVWYKRMDFYRAEVAAGDSLRVFSGDSVHRAAVAYLSMPEGLAVHGNCAAIPTATQLYAEIYHVESRRTSYWYSVERLADSLFLLNPVGFDRYPIRQINLDGNPVASFRWREGKL